LSDTYWEHSDKLVNLIPVFLTAVCDRKGANYITEIRSDFNALGGSHPWKIHDRYESNAESDAKWNIRGTYWIMVAQKVQQTLDQACLDGVLLK
jgi:hypothetical protein